LVRADGGFHLVALIARVADDAVSKRRARRGFPIAASLRRLGLLLLCEGRGRFGHSLDLHIAMLELPLVVRASDGNADSKDSLRGAGVIPF
jgi:hypothetical protein